MQSTTYARYIPLCAIYDVHRFRKFKTFSNYDEIENFSLTLCPVFAYLE